MQCCAQAAVLLCAVLCAVLCDDPRTMASMPHQSSNCCACAAGDAQGWSSGEDGHTIKEVPWGGGGQGAQP